MSKAEPTDIHSYLGVLAETGLLRAAALNLGFGAVPQYGSNKTKGDKGDKGEKRDKEAVEMAY